MKLYLNTAESAMFAVEAVLLAKNLLPLEPSYTTQLDTEFRLNSVNFGNGYRQDALDGLNSDRLMAQVVFTNRSKESINALTNFLKGSASYQRTPDEYFYWLPPYPLNDRGVIKVKCPKFTVIPQSTNIISLSATFEQTFEL